MGHVDEGAGAQFGLVEAEHPAEGRVGGDGVAIQVGDGDAGAGAVEDGTEAYLAGEDRLLGALTLDALTLGDVAGERDREVAVGDRHLMREELDLDDCTIRAEHVELDGVGGANPGRRSGGTVRF